MNELYTDDDSDDGYISRNYLKKIRDRNYVHTYINAGNYRLKILDHIKKRKFNGKEQNSQRIVRKNI